MTIFPREGFYIDPLIKWLRFTVLNPYVTLPIWALITAVLNNQSTFTWNLDLWHGPVNASRVVLLFLTILGSCLSLNDILTTGYLNNWVEDDSWDWTREIVLVTGGSSGIGASIVQQLIWRNKRTRVIVVDYTFQVPDGCKVVFYRCDLSDALELRTVCEKVRSEVGRPTVLVNNAGLTRGRTVMDGTYQDVEITFKTNIVAQFLLVKELLPDMVVRNHGHNFGIASMSALIPPAELADYAATKAGVLRLQECLRQELRFKHNADKVRASAAVLGFIQTPMFKGDTRQSHFLSPLLHVDTVGEAIVDVLYSRNSSTIWYPGMLRYLACLQGGPEWVMEVFRNSTQKLKVDYAGRQQINPVTGKLNF